MRSVLILATSTLTGLPAQWTQRPTPFAGNVVGAAYDEARSVVVAIVAPSGSPVQTWEWNGVAWQQNPSAGSPGANLDEELAVVYDPVGERVLAVDSEGPGSNGGYLAEYRGASWQVIAPNFGAPRPPATTTVAAAFDRVRGVLVAQYWDQTWEWNGAWTLRATTTSPGRIDYARMDYDWLRQRVVLVGGEFYDPVQRRTFTNGTTYEWDGTQWTGTTSIGRELHATTYDAARGRVAMYGGANSRGSGPIWTVYADCVEWDGTNWSSRLAPPTSTLTTNLGSHLACDLARGSMLLVGSETWELVRPTAATCGRDGAGCAGSAGRPRLELDAGRLPWLGQNLQLQASGLGTANVALLALGLSDTTWNGAPLPVLIPGTSSCNLRVSPDAVRFLPAANGAALSTFAVPNLTVLTGLRLFAQALVPDAAANAAGLAVSNALALRVGPR